MKLIQPLPKLDVPDRYQYQVRQIHQVEITSRCNLRCVYCVWRNMPREKKDMDERTFRRVLEWSAEFVADGTQHELNLAGIGESTMHPRFAEYVHLAREILGDDVMLSFATNGLLMDKKMADSIAAAKPSVWVSMHRPEKAGLAIQVLKKAGLLCGVSADPSTAATDWAGQVDWFVSAADNRPCGWVTKGSVFVMSDGTVTTCSFDATAHDVLGTVWDDLRTMKTKPYGLCAGCDQRLNIPGWDQDAGKPNAEVGVLLDQ